jgi:ribulose-phosphate 3-epimerase
MKRPAADWFSKLPSDRLIAEFSLWSANQLRIGDELERIQPHADLLHIDVADGHFAPSFLFFPDLIAQVRSASAIPIHVHLMVDDSILVEQVAQFADVGADVITVHAECPSAGAALDAVRGRGLMGGVVLRVETPVARILPLLDDVHFVTLLGTAIGVKGQSASEKAAGRLEEARLLLAQRHSARRTVLVADGGIREATVPKLRAAGADAVVLGSLAFGAANLATRMAWLASQ